MALSWASKSSALFSPTVESNTHSTLPYIITLHNVSTPLTAVILCMCISIYDGLYGKGLRHTLTRAAARLAGVYVR